MRAAQTLSLGVSLQSDPVSSGKPRERCQANSSLRRNLAGVQHSRPHLEARSRPDAPTGAGLTGSGSDPSEPAQPPLRAILQSEGFVGSLNSAELFKAHDPYRGQQVRIRTESRS